MTWLALLAKYWRPLALVAVISLPALFAYNAGHKAARTACEAKANKALAESAAAETAAVERARAQERDSAERINRLAAVWEKDKQNREESHANDLARLAAGTDRLRAHWAGCKATADVSGSAASAALADAAEQLRRKDTADLIGIGREADSHVKALQRYAESVSGE